jgi:hypothetical protein
LKINLLQLIALETASIISSMSYLFTTTERNLDMRISLKDLNLGIVGLAGAFLLVGCLTSGNDSGSASSDPLSLRSPGSLNHDPSAVNGGANTSNAEKVSICHIPPGNPKNAHTLSVGAPAIRAHLDHGDKLGTCPDPVVVPVDTETDVDYIAPVAPVTPVDTVEIRLD